MGDLRIKSRTVAHSLLYSSGAPNLGATMISINRIVKAGHSVTLEGNSWKVKNQRGNVIADIPADANGLYKVEYAHAALRNG